MYTALLNATGGQTDANFTGTAFFPTVPTTNLSFTIGGTVFALTPAQYLIPAAQYSEYGIPATSGSYSWIGDGGPDGGLNFILGQRFLEHYYSVYDTTYVHSESLLLLDFLLIGILYFPVTETTALA